jgi:DNA-binding NtrC family response regulator
VASPSDDTPLDQPRAIQRLEQTMIARALSHAGGNRTRAAALLGISRRALFRKLATETVPISPISGEEAQHDKFD